MVKTDFERELVFLHMGLCAKGGEPCCAPIQGYTLGTRNKMASLLPWSNLQGTLKIAACPSHVSPSNGIM